MADNFIQSMMARTQARKNTLYQISESGNKENGLSEIPIEVHSHKSEAVVESHPINTDSKLIESAPLSPVEIPDETLSHIEVTNSKRRFKLLAERSKYMNDWEDDYTYHSKSNSKEAEKTNHSAKSSAGMHYGSKNSSTVASSPSKYYFGTNISNNKIASSPKKVASPHKTPVVVGALLAKHDSALSCRSSSPKKLSWDSQLMNTLEAQGFTPTSSQSRLVYDFSKGSKSSSSEINSECKTVQISPDFPKHADTSETDHKIEINSTPEKKVYASVSNLKNKWETTIRNASPERQISPKKHRYVSPQKGRTIASPEKAPDAGLERIGRSPQKLPNKSVVRKRPISPYKPNPAGKIVKGEVPMADTVPLVTTEKASVRDKIAAFSGIAQQKHIENKDPTELSVKDRLNIFERNADKALIPKAPFAQCVPAESKPQQNEVPALGYNYHGQNKGNIKSSQHMLMGKQKLGNADWAWKDSDIHEQVSTERQREMEFLKNRFKKPHQPDQQMESDSEYPESEYSGDGSPQPAPAKPPRVGASPPKLNSESSGSSIAGSPAKRLNSTELYEANASSFKQYEPRIEPGCLFPCLSDIESNSEAMESQDDEDIKESTLATTASEDSLGTCIQRMAENKGTEASERLSTIAELTETQRIHTMGNETIDALAEIDDALDEALYDEKSSPKRIKIDGYECNDKFKTPQASSSSSSDSPSTPLIHSISMYRRQKPAEVQITPLRQVVLKHDICSPENSPVSPSVSINSCIRDLQKEEESQLKVISQASNALSMVQQHPKLQGKDEHVAAEKLLLVSTQKRNTIINEIQRLKAEGALGRSTWVVDDDSSKGSISLSNITIPLKSEFINKDMNGKAYHFVVLVKHREQVIASELLKTPRCVTEGAVIFPNLISLHSLAPEFNIAVEVYCLKTESDGGHSIKKEQSRLKLTPLRRLRKESRAPSPMVQSPGGPFAVRSSSFELVGFAILNINTMTRNAWTLEKVPFNSPLDGHLLMRVSCTMEGGVSKKSFLTMFEDVGGFGAWNRRWCDLNGPFIKYWRYPDDETKKDCLNFIDLRTCTTRKVEVVPWDVCARPHTFQLTLIRPVRKGDQTNLVQEVKDSALISRILISTDSKDERITWCNKLNKALANIRAWDPDALRPEDFTV